MCCGAESCCDLRPFLACCNVVLILVPVLLALHWFCTSAWPDAWVKILLAIFLFFVWAASFNEVMERITNGIIAKDDNKVRFE